MAEDDVLASPEPSPSPSGSDVRDQFGLELLEPERLIELGFRLAARFLGNGNNFEWPPQIQGMFYTLTPKEFADRLTVELGAVIDRNATRVVRHAIATGVAKAVAAQMAHVERSASGSTGNSGEADKKEDKSNA